MPTKKEIEFIRQIHDRITEHMVHKNDELVKPKINKSKLDLKLSNKTDLREISEFIDLYLSTSVKTDSPKFYNQLFSGFSPIGYLGEILTAITNSSMYTFELSNIG